MPLKAGSGTALTVLFQAERTPFDGIWEPAIIIDSDLYTMNGIAAGFSPRATEKNNITGFLPGYFTPGRRPAF